MSAIKIRQSMENFGHAVEGLEEALAGPEDAGDATLLASFPSTYYVEQIAT